MRTIFKIAADAGLVAAAPLIVAGVSAIAPELTAIAIAAAVVPAGAGIALAGANTIHLYDEMKYQRRINALDGAESVILRSPQDGLAQGLDQKFCSTAFNAASKAENDVWRHSFADQKACADIHGSAAAVTFYTGKGTPYTRFTAPVIGIEVSRSNPENALPLYASAKKNGAIRCDGKVFSFS